MEDGRWKQSSLRTKAFIDMLTSLACESGAEATALQTLRDGQTYPNRAERLECGAFTAAFARTIVFINSQRSCAGASGVAAPVFALLQRGKALCHRSPRRWLVRGWAVQTGALMR
jgi:hypothetical protein